MFDSKHEAFMYLQGENRHGDFRKDAIKAIVNDPTYAYAFLSGCEFTPEERKGFIKSIEKDPGMAVWFIRNCHKTNRELARMFLIIAKDLYTFKAFVDNYDFTYEEKVIITDIILHNGLGDSARVMLQKLTVDKEMYDKLQAAIVAHKLTN